MIQVFPPAGSGPPTTVGYRELPQTAQSDSYTRILSGSSLLHPSADSGRALLTYGSSVAKDPYFAYVVQLAHFDGANGSTTLTNSCSRGNTMTVLGTSTISTAQSKWGGSSLRSPSLTSGATGATHADYAFGDSPATVEAWVRFDSLTGNQVAFSWKDDGPLIYVTATGVVNLYIDTGIRVASSAGVATAATWQYYSFCTVGGTTGVARDQYLHVDGVYIGTWSSSYPYSAPARVNAFYDAFGIGGVGYMDDFRVTNGVCRYGPTNYTPPTAPHPDS